MLPFAIFFETDNTHSMSRTPKIIVIVLLVIAGLAGSLYWFVYKPEQEAKEKARLEEEEKARLEQIANEEAEANAKALAAQNKAKTTYDSLLANADAAFEQQNWEVARPLYTSALEIFPTEPYPRDQLTALEQKVALAARLAAGIIEEVTSATGRYYVILSSSVDGDLAKDYALKLLKDGTDVKIIRHYAPDHLYYRVAVEDFDTPEAAKSASETYLSTSSGVWVLKY